VSGGGWGWGLPTHSPTFKPLWCNDDDKEEEEEEEKITDD
jgi:hypothetical protein